MPSLLTVTCATCKGKGTLNGEKFKCSVCEGTGHIVVAPSPTGGPVPCSYCKGAGTMEEGKNKCSACKGSGWAGRVNTLKY